MKKYDRKRKKKQGVISNSKYTSKYTSYSSTYIFISNTHI